MSLSERHWRALRKKARRSKSGIPVASLGFYGPNSEFATKVAVGVVLDPREGVMYVERWYSTAVDVRKDEGVARKIVEALDALGVKQLAILDHILGCPHEEGIDYVEGQACPYCPFWRNSDNAKQKMRQ